MGEQTENTESECRRETKVDPMQGDSLRRLGQSVSARRWEPVCNGTKQAQGAADAMRNLSTVSGVSPYLSGSVLRGPYICNVAAPSSVDHHRCSVVAAPKRENTTRGFTFPYLVHEVMTLRALRTRAARRYTPSRCSTGPPTRPGCCAPSACRRRKPPRLSRS